MSFGLDIYAVIHVNFACYLHRRVDGFLHAGALCVGKTYTQSAHVNFACYLHSGDCFFTRSSSCLSVNHILNQHM
jgi:hypothetical protein